MILLFDQCRTRLRAGIIAVSIVLAAPALADEKGVVTLIFENDIFANADRNYTNGVKAAYIAPWGEQNDWTRFIVNNFWLGADDVNIRSSYAVGHSMFTPDDITIAAPLPNQRPYAGWLYASYGLMIEDTNTLSTMDLEVGIVGPSARAEDLQVQFHEWFGFDDPQGWDNQLNDEPGIAITLERQWKLASNDPIFGFETEFRPNFGVSLGNIRTDAFGGVTFRFGHTLNPASLPPRVRPSLAGSGYFAADSGFSWYGFVGANGRAVAQNIFLDGNTWKDSLSVDKEPFVFDAQAGFALQWGKVQFSYSFIVRTEEYKSQVGGADMFGALGLSIRL